MKRNLSKLVRVPLRDAWKHEASDFTPWLAESENLNALADAVGLGELELVATEHWVGDFKVDILCTDGVDQVIIENQLEKTNHSHLGQIITYAAGIGAKKVIWVAESFRPEHEAAFQFLNQNTTEDLNFFAVEVELWRIGDSPMAPKFEVLVRPNEWVKTGKEQARAASVSTPTKQLQYKFWQALVEEMATSTPGIKPQKPYPQHWLNIRIGKSGFGLNPTVSQRESRLGVEIYIDHKESKRLFHELHSHKSEIEGKLGFALSWQELPDAHACRIACFKYQCPLNDEDRWPEYRGWIIERIKAMSAVFRPFIQAV